MESRYLMRGEKVSLRLITDEDTDLIVKWRNNPRVRDNFVYREVFTPESHREWMNTKVAKGEVVQLIICDNRQIDPDTQELTPVGSVYFRDIDEDNKTAEYGIFIGEDDAIGKGFGNETALLATTYAREQMGLKKLILRAFTDNTPAIKSYENAGFVKIQDLPKVQCSDGQKSDMILMEKVL
ncbi:GNAT family N-acetyltransferase [Butyrivibrio proteoclasticus]|uniref:GNAT family N-acetyltransferase n=1 Tax=Butyrivibrio proteoclasticus TaxID=43305 RepID=UPI00047EED94|nr:GNAT family protein [Butyrivibrio proteoclasticus]